MCDVLVCVVDVVVAFSFSFSFFLLCVRNELHMTLCLFFVLVYFWFSVPPFLSFPFFIFVVASIGVLPCVLLLLYVCVCCVCLWCVNTPEELDNRSSNTHQAYTNHTEVVRKLHHIAGTNDLDTTNKPFTRNQIHKSHTRKQYVPCTPSTHTRRPLLSSSRSLSLSLSVASISFPMQHSYKQTCVTLHSVSIYTSHPHEHKRTKLYMEDDTVSYTLGSYG